MGLIPLLDPEGFAVTAQVCKQLHNYLDRSMEAGGYLGGRHSGSEKFNVGLNVGQKLWYWVAVLAGVVLCVSELLLDFPNFGQSRELLQLSHLFHTIAGVIILAFFIVHLYAAIGIEGTLEAMVSGKVDANWAKQYHDLWYEEPDRADGGGETLNDGGDRAGTDAYSDHAK